MTIPAALILALGLLPADCTVVIHNPAGLALRIQRVSYDVTTTIRHLDEAGKHTLELPCGAYWIAGFSGSAMVARVALPLHRSALRPQRMVITVKPDPSPDPGWCWVPPGPALIGDVLGVGQEDERPARIVDVAGFWMSRDEVTNEQYAEFLNAQPRIDPMWLNLDSRKLGIARKGELWVATRPSEPVVTVSWHGAKAYCDWLTKTSGARHRLPNEEEWEKAARGPESFTYSYGNLYTRAGANQESGALRPVGQYPGNRHGVRDLTGNAFEWVGTIYDRDDISPRYVLRGGSFVLDGMYLRNSFRMYHRPSVQADDFGFRVVRPASSTSGKQPR